MIDEISRIQRGHNHGLMVAGYSGVTNAIRGLDAALAFVEFATRGGIPANGPVISMVDIEASLREILARVAVINGSDAVETKAAA